MRRFALTIPLEVMPQSLQRVVVLAHCKATVTEVAKKEIITIIILIINYYLLELCAVLHAHVCTLIPVNISPITVSYGLALLG